MTGAEMTDLIGCPDASLYDNGHCHDYDIDTETPFTLRVWVNVADNKVTRVKTLSPFAFLHDPSRMRSR
jgi:hypothetical protein